ncbi:MAG: ACT domain-containing protein [Desulfococcaceae bacterium]
MKLEQLSIFLENRSGRLAKILKTLGAADVNIRAMSLADTSDFGILRLIVSDIEKGRQALRDGRFTVRVSEVVAAEVRDRPGELADMLGHIEQAGLNLEYMYSFVQKSMESAILIFRFDDLDRAISVLAENGFRIVESHELW